MKLSVAIITFNEERIISKTLAAIRGIADEVVIVDSHSTDRTVDIAKSFGAKVYIEDWKGFGPQKNSAIDKCSGEWVLFLDADEVVSSELAINIKDVICSNIAESVFKIKLNCVCFNKEIKYGGWSKKYHIRLWKNGTVRYDDEFVHESLITDDKIGIVRGIIYHYTYLTLNDYFRSFNNYTTLAAKEYYKKNKKVKFVDLTLNPLFNFTKMYFIKFGFLDGIEGLLLALSSSLYTMTKYYKLKEIYKNNSYLHEKHD